MWGMGFSYFSTFSSHLWVKGIPSLTRKEIPLLKPGMKSRRICSPSKRGKETCINQVHDIGGASPCNPSNPTLPPKELQYIPFI